LDASDIAPARSSIRNAIAAVEAEIAASPNDGEGMQISQLQQFRANLLAILGDVDRIAKGERPRPVSGIGHIIVDSWLLGSPTGIAILGGEQEYESLLKRWARMQSDAGDM